MAAWRVARCLPARPVWPSIRRCAPPTAKRKRWRNCSPAPRRTSARLAPAAAEDRSAVPEALRAYVGRRLPLKVIEADPRRDRLILSEKAAAQAVRRKRKEEAAHHLSEGDELDGTVSSVTTFGLFVDVGVADGLVHRSEITWQKGVEPTALYKPGDRVRVLVCGIDRDRGRISLSIKRLA